MAYEPTNWKTGDVVTSGKLNKLEQGVAGAGGVIMLTPTVGETQVTYGITYDEVKSAMMSGKLIMLTDEYEKSHQLLIAYNCEDGSSSSHAEGGIVSFGNFGGVDKSLYEDIETGELYSALD